MRKPKITKSQKFIAVTWGIPYSQAHLINPKKHSEYTRHLMSPEARLEVWFDKLATQRRMEGRELASS